MITTGDEGKQKLQVVGCGLNLKLRQNHHPEGGRQCAKVRIACGQTSCVTVCMVSMLHCDNDEFGRGVFGMQTCVKQNGWLPCHDPFKDMLRQGWWGVTQCCKPVHVGAYIFKLVLPVLTCCDSCTACMRMQSISCASQQMNSLHVREYCVYIQYGRSAVPCHSSCTACVVSSTAHVLCSQECWWGMQGCCLSNPSSRPRTVLCALLDACMCFCKPLCGQLYTEAKRCTMPHMLYVELHSW